MQSLDLKLYAVCIFLFAEKKNIVVGLIMLAGTLELILIYLLCSMAILVQYVDREGKTPLIVACMNLTLYNVAKTLIELGANVNSYRPGMINRLPFWLIFCSIFHFSIS